MSWHQSRVETLGSECLDYCQITGKNVKLWSVSSNTEAHPSKSVQNGSNLIKLDFSAIKNVNIIKFSHFGSNLSKIDKSSLNWI